MPPIAGSEMRAKNAIWDTNLTKRGQQGQQKRTAAIKTEIIQDDDYILHGVDANSVESEHSDNENIEADWESRLLAEIEPVKHF